MDRVIIGSHVMINSKDPEADRAFLRDVLGLPNVDAGGGWLIFGLPSGEVAVHPSDVNDVHEFYLLSDDIDAFVAAMRDRKVHCAPITEQRWGRLTHLTLPGGGKLSVYEPLHPRPDPAAARAPHETARKGA